MIELKRKENVFNQNLSYKNNSIVKSKGFFKKSFISLSLLCLTAVSLDIGTSVSNGVKMSNFADSRAAYFESVETYSAFKNKADAVPYSKSDFEKDMALFKFIYVDSRNNTLFTYLNETNTFDAFVRAKYKYNGIDNTKHLAALMGMLSKDEYFSEGNENIQKLQNNISIYKDKLKNNLSKKESLDYVQYSFSTGDGYTKDPSLPEKMYSNIIRYSSEQRIDANLFLLKPEQSQKYIELKSSLAYSYDKDNAFIKKTFNEMDNVIAPKNVELQKMVEAYEQHDYDKLYNIFKTFNAFYTIISKDRPQNNSPEMETYLTSNIYLSEKERMDWAITNSVDKIKRSLNKNQKGAIYGDDKESSLRGWLVAF
ncbi:hypothetical protein [Serratia sp. Se-RSBMAAmG]|uniref:hypothetical protein n=1 Tax=Serratia sp. Se-RSBMAAmG TaxID=3043305 RepID=UPI0024AF8A55|nr:hypothetical protein [Serratia sp. Se-RSBMAAmG]MDI6975978.1 hypothetical protein [Serratia sp. Se-RSBMAAmG]